MEAQPSEIRQRAMKWLLPRQHPRLDVRLLEHRGELLVVDHDGRLLALEHVDQLGAGEGGVQVQQVGAELGRGDRGLDETAMVPRHQRDGVALLEAELLQAAGQGVGAPVHLAEGELTQLVDDPDPVRHQRGHRQEAAGRTRPPLLEDACRPSKGQRRVGPDDAGLGQDLEAVAGRGDAAGQLLEDGRQVEREGRHGRRMSGDRLGGDQPGGRPVLADRGGGGLGEPGDRRGLGDVGGLDGVGSADLGGEQPDRAAADQVGQRVDEAVDQVAVLGPPPQHDGVHDVAVVAVDHVRVDGVLDRDPELVVGVVVPPELLDDGALGEAQPVSRARRQRLSGWTRHPRSSSLRPPPLRYAARGPDG